MRVNVDAINREIINTDRYYNMYHKNPYFRRVMDMFVNRPNVQESEFVHIISQICEAADRGYKNETVNN